MQPQILVPLDGSSLAETALPHALLLARTTGSALTLLRVVLPPSRATPLVSPVNLQAWEADWLLARHYLERLAAHLETEQLPIGIALVAGDPAATILEYATEHPQVRTIVLATHGRSGLNRWVFGSVAELVLHVTPVPLLLVRPGAEGRAAVTSPAQSYRKILIPLDESELSEQALVPAQALAKDMNAFVTLLSVVPSRDEHARVEPDVLLPPLPRERTAQATQLESYLAEKAQPLREAGLQVETRVVYGYPAEAILQAGEQMGADLLIMATHARTAIQRIRLGSVGLKVMQGAQQPVLLVRQFPQPASTGVQPAADEASGGPPLPFMMTGYVQDS